MYAKPAVEQVRSDHQVRVCQPAGQAASVAIADAPPQGRERLRAAIADAAFHVVYTQS